MCGYFYVGLIDFMLKGDSLTDFTNLFSANDFKKSGDIIFLTIFYLIFINGLFN